MCVRILCMMNKMEPRDHYNFSYFFPSPGKMIKLSFQIPVWILRAHLAFPGRLTSAVQLIGISILASFKWLAVPFPLYQTFLWLSSLGPHLQSLAALSSLTIGNGTPIAAVGVTLFHSWPYSLKLETVHPAALGPYFRAHKLNLVCIFLVKPPCS